MSTNNISFFGELTKIILQLSSNTLLICSTVLPGLGEFMLFPTLFLRDFNTGKQINTAPVVCLNRMSVPL